MTAARRIMLEAAVSATERAAIGAAQARLADALSFGSGEAWTVDVRWCEGIAVVGSDASATIAIASMQLELARTDEPLPAIEARWRAALARAAASVPVVVVCTVLRVVAEPTPPGAGAAETASIERIRRLNRLLLDLSHDVGVRVADIDRALAHLGARTLATDHRLASPAGASAAGWSVALAAIAPALDGIVPPDVQERARKRLGSVSELAATLAARGGPP